MNPFENAIVHMKDGFAKKFSKPASKPHYQRLVNKKRSKYQVVKITRERKTNDIVGDLTSSKRFAPVSMTINEFPSEIFRIKLIEKSSQKYRLDVEKDVLELSSIPPQSLVDNGEKYSVFSVNKKRKLLISKKQFLISILLENEELITFNHGNRLVIENGEEYSSQCCPNPSKCSPGVNDELFSYGLRFDVNFPKSKFFYGLGERCFDLTLKNNNKNDPYRIFNLDKFNYMPNDKYNLYGSIPFLLSVNENGTASGVFYLNPTDTYFNVSNKSVEFISSCGILNLFFIVGESPKSVIRKFSSLVGKPYFPPYFSLGYHQSRWSYKTQKDAEEESIWLDIDFSYRMEYFYFNKDNFPTPREFLKKLNKRGRKCVTINDPHIKVNNAYDIYCECKKNKYFVKDENGNQFIGKCWPGDSSWLDLYNPKVREYYSEKFISFEPKKSKNLFTWIDMNEPSVFVSPESFHPGYLHHNNVKNGEIHNLYGHYHCISAYNGQVKRYKNRKRPFVLTRSFFAGVQKYAFCWTGDNKSTWDHLRISIPMLLTLGICGMPFVGADVGGFNGNPSEELLIRWNQAALFYPFFRGHSIQNSGRREPWCCGNLVLEKIRKVISDRYVLLSYIYTQVYKVSQTGVPLLSALFLTYPKNERTYEIQDVFMFGEDILAAPVLRKGIRKKKIYFPSENKWYDFKKGFEIPNDEIEVSITINSIPYYQRGGSVIPLFNRDNVVGSSELFRDVCGIILQFALSKEKKAEGFLYLDDGNSFRHKTKNEYILKNFKYEKGSIVGRTLHSNYKKSKNNIEKIVIFGWEKVPKKIVFVMGDADYLEALPVKCAFEEKYKKLIIFDINVDVRRDFKVEIVV